VIGARTVTIKGRPYRLMMTHDYGVMEAEEKEPDVTQAATSNIPAKDLFKGTSRRIAKTTIFNGAPESVGSVRELIPTLADNDTMRGKHIPKTPNSNRVAEEKRNVSVKAYIYAFKKEADNDYHVIVGDEPGSPNPQYFNVEVSGIPIAGTDENRDRLRAVRKTFEEGYGLGGSWQGGYAFLDTPTPVRITGSLFFDVDHENPPFVGPGTLKPGSAWEIHPISELEFLD